MMMMITTENVFIGKYSALPLSGTDLLQPTETVNLLA